MKFGADYCFLQTFNLRAGYMTNNSERGFTAGIGIHTIFEEIPLRLDYAYELQEEAFFLGKYEPMLIRKKPSEYRELIGRLGLRR